MNLARHDASPLARWMDGPLRTIAIRIPIAVTPNQLTAVGFVCGIGSATALLFASCTRAAYIAAAAVLLGHWFADTLDGLLARARHQVSQTGYFLDHFGDAIITTAVTVAMFASGGSHLAIGLVSVCLLLLLHVLVHVKVAVLGRMELPA